MKKSDIKVELINHMGDDLSVVNAARVSFHKESEWGGTCFDPALKISDANLIGYLARNKHFSPFNHTFISVRVKAPVFVARQLVKHKFMPWNEVSRRYVDEEPEFYFPKHWRKKAENVKQGSSEEAVYCSDEWMRGAEYHIKTLALMYDNMLDSGICAEQARMILPQNMMTEWHWSGTLGAFADMLRLRLDPHTQKETREVAEAIKGLVEPLFPVSLKALLEVK
jgi:thymidylate synthase (FAD)